MLGKLRVRDLTHADVQRLVRSVASSKPAAPRSTGKLRGVSIVRGGRGVATRTAGLLGGILAYAVSEGVIPVNPATGVRKPAYQKRTGRLTPDDYAALGRALAACASEGVAPAAIGAIRLLALTGCRRNEIVGLRWAELDVAGQALRLQDSKEGASVRPIGATALDVAASLPRDDGALLLFPAPRRAPGEAYGGLKGAWRAVIGRAGLQAVTPHTLRHSFASVAGDLGYSESTIGALLGHASGSVTGRYTHHLDAVLIAAADRVAGEINRQMAAEL